MRLSRKTMQPFTAEDQREEQLAQRTAERQALIEKRKEQLYEAIAQSFTPVGAPVMLGGESEPLAFPVASTYSTREEIIQGCRAQQQFCGQQAEENAQTALMVENMGDWATSQRLWERAAHNQGLADYFGQAAARYESAPAPMTAPQPTAPSPSQEEDEPEAALSYEENLRLAMENYPIYQEKLKDLKVNYLWMRDPEADAGYHPANMEMQQYREGYLAPMDDILDNLERIVPTGVTGTPVTAAERESLLVQRDQLIQELWDLYHASDGELDPAAAAIYTDQIARLNAVLAAESTGARHEEITPVERIKQTLIAAGTEMAGGYTQGFATTAQWLAERIPGGTQGYETETEVTLQHLREERDAYLAVGLPEDTPVIVRLNDAIQSLENWLVYIESGQLMEAREAERQDVYASAENMYNMSEQAEFKAKEGLDTVGSCLVDVGIGGCRALVNTAIGVLLRNPKATRAAELVLSFGDGAYQAVKNGGDADAQMTNGLVNVVLDYMANKAKPGKDIYDNVIKRFTRSSSMQISTDLTLREQLASLTLNSFGDALVSLGKDCIDPIYNYLVTGEIDAETAQELLDDALSEFVLNLTENAISSEE